MFAYCLNNSVCYSDPDGYHKIPASKGFELKTLDPEGNNPWYSSLHIPNARPVETWQEVAEITVEFGTEIARSDGFQDLTSTRKIYVGIRTMLIAGAALFVPDPLPMWDEMKNLYSFVNGFKNLVLGIAVFFDWEAT